MQRVLCGNVTRVVHRRRGGVRLRKPPVLPRQPLPTHRTDKTTTTTVTNFEPPISESFKSTDDYNDMEGTLTFPSHQEFLKKSPGAQSYDLERDFTTSGPTLGSTFSAPRGPSQVQQLRKAQSKSITAPPVFAH